MKNILKSLHLCSLMFLTFRICSAGLTEELDNVYPFPFEASFERSNTEDSIKGAFLTFAHQGRLTGYNYGNCVMNGYGQIVGAMIEYKNSKEPWFKQPFVWLKDNTAIIPGLIKRNGYKLTSEHILFVNYLLSSYGTVTAKPDWIIKFHKIKLLYSQFKIDWKYDIKEKWAQENCFIKTLGAPSDGIPVIPDYVAWGLAKDWIGARAYPSVFESSNNKEVLWNINISFENYLASFWYRRWADGSMNAVFTTLKLISAFVPRNFEKQKKNGFVDSIPSALSRTAENWELYPTPSAKITCVRVREDGKSRVDSVWTAIVPTAVKLIDIMPPVENYFMVEESLRTPDSEGATKTMIIKMAPMESSSSPVISTIPLNTKTPELSNSSTDLKKFDDSDPVTTINNLTKVYDPYARFFTYNKDKDLLEFTTSDIKIGLTLSDVNLQIVKGGNQEFYIQFLCRDALKCVECSYTDPASITAITVKNKDAAEKIIALIEKLRTN